MKRSRKVALAGALLVACSGDGSGPGNAATQLALTMMPSVVTAGVPLSPPLRVTALDSRGAIATSFSGGVSIVLAANPGGATLSGTTTVNAAAGVATFSNLVLNRSGSGYLLAATAAGLTGATSNALTVTPGPASAVQSTVSAAPGSITASSGASVSTVTVTARDTFGNPVPGVTVALAASGAGNALTQPAGPTDAAGVASGSLSSTEAASKTVSATVNGAAVTQTTSITVNSGGASQLAITVQPSNATAGNTITPAVAVAAWDAFGNVAGTYSGDVTVAIAANPGAGALAGTKTIAVTNGVATFTDLSIDKAGTGYTLQAVASPTLTTATSTPFDVTTGSAVKLAFFVQPSGTTGGATIAPAIQVEVQDAGGNRVATATSSVTLAFGTNPKNATLGGTKTEAAAAGLATFTDLTIDSAATGYSLTASAIGLAGATSSAFNITVGAAANLGFLVQPSNATGGAVISPTVQVEIRDAGGNQVTSATNTVTVAIGTDANNGTLGGTKSVGAVAGIATYSTLTVDSSGTGYTLTAAGTGLTPATSNAFNIAVGPAARLGFRVQPSGAVSGATISPPVQVEIRDAGGNRVITANHAITLAIQSNPGGGTLSGIASLAATNGLAAFNGLSIDKAGTGYTLQATASPVLAAATSTPFTIASGLADHVAFFVQPAGAAAGATITPAVQVEIQDAAGNRVTGATNSVTVAIADNPNGGALSGTKTLAAVSGVASFAGLSIDRAGTGYTLLASATGLGSATSNDFNVTAGAAIRLAFFVEPSTTTAGSAIAPGVQVEILDGFGNRVGTATTPVTVALLANPGGGTLSGTKSRNASAGVATFDNLSINKTGTGYTIRATATALTADTSVAFSITPGTATQLVFTTQPSTTTAGAIIPAVQVTTQDALGNTATGFTGNVAMTLGANPGSGTLSGTSAYRLRAVWRHSPT